MALSVKHHVLDHAPLLAPGRPAIGGDADLLSRFNSVTDIHLRANGGVNGNSCLAHSIIFGKSLMPIKDAIFFGMSVLSIDPEKSPAPGPNA